MPYSYFQSVLLLSVLGLGAYIDSVVQVCSDEAVRACLVTHSLSVNSHSPVQFLTPSHLLRRFDITNHINASHVGWYLNYRLLPTDLASFWVVF